MTTVSERPQGGVPDWTLGWRLQRALSYADLKVEDMAADLGVGRSTVSRWLNDRGPVREIYLKRWALRTGVSYQWLKTGTLGLPESPDPASPIRIDWIHRDQRHESSHSSHMRLLSEIPEREHAPLRELEHAA